MRYAFIFLILLFSNCSEDRLATGPEDFSLGYDGPNSTSPQLPGGQYQLATKFPAALTSSIAGQQITEIAFYIYDVPRTCEVRIYGSGSPNQPGPPLYSANVGGDLRRDRWNYHVLTTPVDVTAEDIWVAIRFSHNNDQQTLGCDAGPRNIDGDWSLFSSDNQWLTFRARTNADINWNIRCKVQ